MTPIIPQITRFALVAALAGALTASFSHQTGAQSTAMPGRLLANSAPGNGGLFEVNTNDTNLVNLTPGTYSGNPNRNDSQPSISADGKRIAFASFRNTANQRPHIWIMNADGTGAHALTFDAVVQTGSDGTPLQDTTVYDQYPVISPDGTKIAFIANRSTHHVGGIGSGYTYDSVDLYVINTDGSGLHQVTESQPNIYGNGAFGSTIYSAAWGPDSNQLVVSGTRFVTQNNTTLLRNLLFFINSDGSGYTPFQDLTSTGAWGAVDWSPDGRYIAAPYGGEAQGAPPVRFYIWDLTGGNNHTLFYNAQSVAPGVNLDGFLTGTFRFSPDSKQIVFLTTSDNYTTDHPTITNLDGSGLRVMKTKVSRFTWLWWQSGPAVPKPWKLTLQGNGHILLLHNGSPGIAVTPTLYDKFGNVIVHAVADWNPSSTGFFTVDINGIATPIRTAYYGALSLVADNGGINSNTLGVMVDLPILRAQLANVFKQGDGTIRINLNVTNSGLGAAPNLVITSASLDGQPAIANVGGLLPPYPLGDLQPGGVGNQYYSFSPSSKPSGTKVQLRITGTYDWYLAYSTTLTVTLP